MNIERIVIVIVLFGLISTSCSKEKKQNLNSLSHEEKEEGWILLFDGKSFNGWRCMGWDNIPEEIWKIEDGCLKRVANNTDKGHFRGDLITTNAYKNFELQFEWKISEAGNSGIKYNVSEDLSKKYNSKYFALGFEYQILDDQNKQYAGILKPNRFTASLYDMIAPSNFHLMPVGEFNASRIILNGNHCEHWLNQIKVLEYDLGTAKFDSLYQKSKYSKYAGFEKKREGHIVITDHIDETWFRNIKIKELNYVHPKD